MWIPRLKLCSRHLELLCFSGRVRTTASLWKVGRAWASYNVDQSPIDPLESAKSKILYNSLTTPTHYLEVFRRKKLEHKQHRNKNDINTPVALKFVDQSFEIKKDEAKITPKNVKPNLPYRYSVQFENLENQNDERETVMKTGVSIESMMFDESIKGRKTWMNDYEKYCSGEDSELMNDWLVNYGTPDPEVAWSDVGCGGCGAYLHCREPSLPGYLPSEIFLECTRSDLLSLLCQRCHFLKNYNTALSVQVNPDKYASLISKIEPKALVLLMVDITDIGGSVWPGIVEILGKDRPIFLVGNKVDLLWGDSVGWLQHVENVLRKSLMPKTKLLGSCLISATTGFGVEDLVTKIQKLWKGSGDVYLVGCTNVGKSTLFNALIQSDLCKTKAVDLVQRATTAPWPGTTLNLLKFPILRPAAWRIAIRNIRLEAEKSRIKAEKELQKIQRQVLKKRPSTPPQLIGNIAHSFSEEVEEDDENEDFSIPKRVSHNSSKDYRKSLVDCKDKEFEGRWCYDTPGVLHSEQILDLLTGEELLSVLPREPILPRSFLIYPGISLMVACLARLDYISGQKPIRLTVFSSNQLPITVCKTQDAFEVYKDLLGSNLTLIPNGSSTRLQEWPGLSASDVITLCGSDEEASCADVTFSTTGWIGVTPESREVVKLQAWSPLGRGISIRHPSLLPYAVKLRGRKIPRSPAYSRTKALVHTKYK